MTRPLNIDSTDSRSATQPAQCPRGSQTGERVDSQTSSQTGRQTDRQIVTDKQEVRQMVSNLVFYAQSTSMVIQPN